RLIRIRQRQRWCRVRVERWRLRQQQHRDDHQQVDDEGEQDTFAPRDRAPNRLNIGSVVVEIEIHQEVTSSITVQGWRSEAGGGGLGAGVYSSLPPPPIPPGPQPPSL